MGELLRMTPTTLPTRSTGAYDARPRPEPLWRELTGRVLRRHRHERTEKLAETAQRAGVSTQYLSELERGRKDASSEILAAVAGALDLTLLDLTREVARDLAPEPARDLRSGQAPVGRLRGPLALAA